MGEVESLAIPSLADPNKLVAVLKDSGWRALGGRSGVYMRYAPPGSGEGYAPPGSLLVPLNPDAPDFSFSMHSALAQLAQDDRDFWIRVVYPRLAVTASDAFRFQKESSAPSGLISWRSGERLIESARRTFLAGAKFYLGPEKHFVNKHGRFANRYLDLILMGQTAPGSYIVTAFAPPEASVSLKSSIDAGLPLHDPAAPQVREVNEAVARAVGATVEALEHYRSSGSLSGFEAGVISGVSYEMTNALLGMTTNSTEANIEIEWDSGHHLPRDVESRFVFTASDADPLYKAAVRLAEDDQSQQVLLMGRVHLLAKKDAGSPGVFGIENLRNSGPKKVRVRLSDEEDYHEAVRAHDEDLAIEVAGRLEKEGNLSWLYDATVVRTVGPLEDFAPKRRKFEALPGQLDMF